MSRNKLPPAPQSPQMTLTADPGSRSHEEDFLRTGPKFVLNKVAHQLPSPSLLSPYIDQQSGSVDTWPAHGSALLATTNASSKSAAKPKFLRQLETFLQKELRVLGCSISTIPSEKRLQVFREVFEFLIDNFKTYKPLLSSIKNEYEAMLMHYREKVRDLEPLKGMLVNVSDKCEQRILNLKQEEKEDVKRMRIEIDRLQKVVKEMRDEHISLNAQVKKCQEEIAFEYRRYRDESDARKLLIQDLNDLKYQQDESKRNSAGAGEDGDNAAKKEDAVVLRIALKKAREDLQLKTQKLAEVTADYGDVVPRRDYETAEAQLKSLQSQMATLQSDHDTLAQEHSVLIELHKKVIEQRDKFAVECERLKRCSTPRPDWSKCGVYVSGGVERWDQISADCSSSDKVDILLSEMSGQDLASIKSSKRDAVEFFQAKGTSESVARHLRGSGQIRNRHLGRRDAAVLVKEIWQERIKQEGTKPNGERTAMPAFLHAYLLSRFGTETLALEWAYSFEDALTRYNFDSKLKLFNGILREELDEDIYYDHLSNLEGLLRILTGADSTDQGVLPLLKFKECLRHHFNHLSGDHVEALADAAQEELGSQGDLVHYRDLFTEDDEGKTGLFISLVDELENQDKQAFIREIDDELGSKSDVAVDDFRLAILAVDPSMSSSAVDLCVSKAFTSPGQQKMSPAGKIQKTNLIQNLSASSLRRTSRR